jgi:hypothetical protein
MQHIYGGESDHKNHWDSGDHGDSGGPFQLDTAGGRLGAQFERSHPGMSVHDPNTLQAQADFVADWKRRHPNNDGKRTWFRLNHPDRFGHLKGGYAPQSPDHVATSKKRKLVLDRFPALMCFRKR